MQKQLVVRTEGLTKRFDQTEALLDYTCNIYKGEIYGILGVNGAGKTTLLKLLGGLLNPTYGMVWVLGQEMPDRREMMLGKIGSIIETPCFYENLSAGENLQLHLAYMQKKGEAVRALELVGLAHATNQPVRQFSLGMRQRLAIARAIIHRPELLLLDEPINGLDPIAIRELRGLMKRLAGEGMTIILSSHILSEMEQTADRIAVISGGRLTAEHRMAELQAQQGLQLEEYLIQEMNGGKVNA